MSGNLELSQVVIQNRRVERCVIYHRQHSAQFYCSLGNSRHLKMLLLFGSPPENTGIKNSTCTLLSQITCLLLRVMKIIYKILGTWSKSGTQYIYWKKLNRMPMLPKNIYNFFKWIIHSIGRRIYRYLKLNFQVV